MNPAPPVNPTQVLAGLFALGLLGAIIAAWIWALVRMRARVPLLPGGKPKPVPWGPGSVVAVVVLWVLLNAVTVRVLAPRPAQKPAAAGPKAAARPPELAPAEQLTILAVINGAILLLVPPLLRLTSGATAADLGLAGPLGVNMARGAVACLLLLPCVYGVMALATRLWKPQQHPVAQMVLGDASGHTAVLAVISGVLLAPAAEELFFRAMLLGWLTSVRSRLRRAAARPASQDVEILWLDEPGWTRPEVDPGPRDFYAPPQAPISQDALPGEPGSISAADLLVPNAITSALFAALHTTQWPAPIPLFLLSMGLGLLYQRTGSLIGPITLHALFNGLSTTVLFLAVHAGQAPPPKAVPPPAAQAILGPATVPHKKIDGCENSSCRLGKLSL
jgi:membrane protease YdiL (CAAX protease family)